MHEKHPNQSDEIGPMGPTCDPAPPHPQSIEVTRTYLDMAALEQLIPGPPPTVTAALERIDPAPVEQWRALYRQIGAPWQWHDRDAWPDSDLAAHLARPDIRLFRVVADLGDGSSDEAGFLELERHTDGSVEIVYLGLHRRLHGHRLGAWLVSAAVRVAFAWDAERVWLHTCTLDAPAALPNYLARGFLVARAETYHTQPRRL
jgi:GNAT superfamily N-acetyltransferase